MPEELDRRHVLTLRARANLFRQAASYMSLRAAKDDVESYAAHLEQEADALERDLRAAAVARAEAIPQALNRAELLAEMKSEPTNDPALETEEASPDAVRAMFKTRAARLRELAAGLTADDKELLLTIATEYEELVNALAPTSVERT